MNKMSKEELMQKIRELSFVKTELELFLDAAPNNKLALDQFHKTLDALIAAREEYEANYGPITTEGVSRDRWNWIDGPWPWQKEGEMPAPDAPLNCRGERM